MIEPSRPRRIQLEGFKEELECDKIEGYFVERVHEFFDVYVRYQAWESQQFWKSPEIKVIISAGLRVEGVQVEVKNEENLQILVFVRGFYQSRQMEIKARVGKQCQLG